MPVPKGDHRQGLGPQHGTNVQMVQMVSVAYSGQVPWAKDDHTIRLLCMQAQYTSTAPSQVLLLIKNKAQFSLPGALLFA